MKKFFTYKTLSIFLLLVITLLVYSEISASKNSNVAEAFVNSSSTGPDDVAYDCFDNYTSWAHSTVLKKNASWSTLSFPVRNFASTTREPYRNYIDVNGDGLIDYLYGDSSYSYYITRDTPTGTNYNVYYPVIKECLLLNTGTGWDVSFKCRSLFDSATNTVTYYGDCAQL